MISVKNKNNSRIRLGEIVILVSVFFVLFLDVVNVFPSLYKDLMLIGSLLTHFPNYSYDDKIKEKVGSDYYNWTKLVKEHTMISSLVMHPPQMWPWPQSGNPEFSQYFLYPAKLIREDRKRLFEEKDITHVLIAWGEGQVDSSLYGWPQFPVFAQKIYYLSQRRKVEVRGIDRLEEWRNNAQRQINEVKENFFDLTYTSSEFDYWMRQVNSYLLPTTAFNIQVKSNWLNSTALIAKVSFGSGRYAVFSSSPNQRVNEWENLSLDNLYDRAYEFAKLQGWSSAQPLVEAVGIDTGHPAKMPYLEKWGIMEVEKGGSERLKFLNEQPVNSQTQLSLANIYSLDNKEDRSMIFYQKALLLEPSNPWGHFGIAEEASKLDNKILAKQKHERTIQVAPEISWFYFALGDFYRKDGNIEQAINQYRRSLNLYPESFWTLLAMGETYEQQNQLNLAYQYYRLASNGARRAFSDEGRIAGQNVDRIKSSEEKMIKTSLVDLKNNPQNWQSLVDLSNAHAILGEAEEAKNYFKEIIKKAPEKYHSQLLLRSIPIVIDNFSQPTFGEKGKALESTKNQDAAGILDNYHSYVKYSQKYIPEEEGTIELEWKPPSDFNQDEKPRNLIFQFRGLLAWITEKRLKFALFDRTVGEWKIISSPPLAWDIDKWYNVAVSFGKKGMYLALDNKTITQGEYNGTINKENDMYFGRGPLWLTSNKQIISGYFKHVKIYDYQLNFE